MNIINIVMLPNSHDSSGPISQFEQVVVSFSWLIFFLGLKTQIKDFYCTLNISDKTFISFDE